MSAHRAAYLRHHNLRWEQIKGRVVRHTCDNPPCINPEHLVLGSHHDNMQDMVKRGRSTSALTEEAVRHIRSSYIPRNKEYSARALARKYGVTDTAIRQIVLRKRWSHLA